MIFNMSPYLRGGTIFKKVYDFQYVASLARRPDSSKCVHFLIKTMIFNIDHIVSYVSRYMSLQPGDIITTGTPPGVGMGMKPQKFLKAGDEMRLSIELLGEQRSKVVAI